MIFAVLLVILAALDTVLTYRGIRSGKGKEAAFAKLYIHNVPLTIGITAIGVALIVLITWQAPWIMLLPIAAFGYACWNNWRILHG